MGGGSKTTSVTIPKWLEDAARGNIARAEEVSRIGYAPYYGPDVAGLTPGNMASMRGTANMASAFGAPSYDPTQGMPVAGDYGGMSAYSAGPMYDAALEELRRRQPDTYAKLMAPFANQTPAVAPSGVSATPTGVNTAAANRESPSKAGYGGTGYAGGAGGASGGGVATFGGGYTGLRDALNGGGPGQAGATFSGGGKVSAVLNALGTKPRGAK